MVGFRGIAAGLTLAAGMFVLPGLTTPVLAQGLQPLPRDYRPAAPDPRLQAGPPAPQSISTTISEATAILESVVRTMYTRIEPGRDNSPNELMAYADLRVLRLYAGALEVAGWSLEQAYTDYLRFHTGGHYRNGYSHIQDRNAQIAWERYRAYRETVRTMLLRVRTTAVSVEHQVGFCDPSVAREWQRDVLPALRDTIAATEPLLVDDYSYQRYTGPATASTTAIVVPASSNGLPANAVEVGGRLSTHSPYNGQGHGRGRYFEVRSYGGAIRIKGIRYNSFESAFGLAGTTQVRELAIDQIVEPGRPLFVSCNRGRWVDASNVEIIWERGDRGSNRTYGSIDIVDGSPTDPAR